MSGVSGVSGISVIPFGGIPPYGFALGECTFTPGMAKRTGEAGVFDAAPIVQGIGGTVVGDRLSNLRGGVIGNPTAPHFYSRLDKNQGSIVFWVTPEFAPADMVGARFFSDFYMEITVATTTVLQFAYYDTGWRSANVNIAAWTAGTPHCICARYDTKSALDGTNHLCLSVDGVDTFGGTQLDVGIVGSPGTIGSRTDGQRSGQCIIEGLTVYRRVLYDGTYGTPPVDQTDELAAIYAAGAGLDPAQVTGSWDATLCIPTDSTPGALTTGTGEAWSHPHADSLPDVSFMSDGGPPGTPFAVEFNGTSTYVNCGSGATLDDIPAGGGQITVGIWFRMDRTSGEAVLIQKGQYGASGWVLFTNSNGHVQGRVYLATANAEINYPESVRDGKLHYAAFHYDDTTKAVRVLLDGRWSSADVGVGAYQSDAAQNLVVGRRVATGAWYLQGGAAWWEVWDNDHHGAGVDFIPSRTPTAAGPGNLIETWWADEGTGATVAARVTTPGNDGTITVGTWSAVWEQDGTPVIPQSLQGDGTATSINGGSGATVDNLPTGANGFTAECWICIDQAEAGMLLAKWAGWMFYTTGTQLVVIVDYDTTNATINHGFAAGDKIWHHLAITYDENTDRKAYLWVDGILDSVSGASVGAYIGDAAGSVRVINPGWMGSMPELRLGWVRFSDTVRYTGATIGKAYFVPDARSNPPGVDGNTMLQWDMQDGAGTTTTDTSGNANHGTITMGTGQWLNTPDMETESPGEQGPYEWGYAMGSDGVGDGITIIEDKEVVAGTSYVMRASLSIGMSSQAWPAVYAYDNIGAANLLTHRFPRMTGPHTGANNAASLTDAGARWIYNLTGWTIYNITDGSSATVTSNTEYNVVGGLAGGTDNDWDTNDVYRIMPPSNRSYSQHPWQETVVFTAPAGCTSVNIRVLNLAGEGVTHIHQVEVYESLVTNGDMEVGGANPWLPTGWANNGLDPGDSAAEAGTIHSGSQSMRLAVTAINEGAYSSIGALVAEGKYVGHGFWAYCDGSSFFRWTDNGGIDRLLIHSDASNRNSDSTTTALWLHTASVWRRSSALANFWGFFAITGAAGNRYLDDVYTIELADVSLTVTPASYANSLEPAPDHIRVDGYDTLTQPITSSVAATSGHIQWSWIPRHDGADALDFGHLTPYIAAFVGAGTNYIQVYWAGVNQLRLAFNNGGGEVGAIWNTGGVFFNAGTTYQFEVTWNAVRMRLWVDGVVRITVNSPTNFAALPATAWWGTTNAATNLNGDAVFTEF